VLLEGAQSSVDAAQDHLSRALNLARQQGALSWELRVATSLSRCWHDRGGTKEACDLLSPIYDRFTEGFGTGDLVSAKTLLGLLR
jgi:predicted ATPase